MSQGIIHQLSSLYTPKQIEIVERKHRPLIESTRCRLYNSQIPREYWFDACLTSIFTINRHPFINTKNISWKYFINENQIALFKDLLDCYIFPFYLRQWERNSLWMLLFCFIGIHHHIKDIHALSWKTTSNYFLSWFLSWKSISFSK